MLAHVGFALGVTRPVEVGVIGVGAGTDECVLRRRSGENETAGVGEVAAAMTWR